MTAVMGVNTVGKFGFARTKTGEFWKHTISHEQITHLKEKKNHPGLTHD